MCIRDRNQIYWLDQINGARTLDVFDVHSYVGDNVDTTGPTNSQLRAAAGKVYRTYWDPQYYNSGNEADWITTTQPNRGVTFLIPRLKALVNAIYPGTDVYKRQRLNFTCVFTARSIRVDSSH